VTNVSPDVCFRIREARRLAKLSQSVVAAEVGCKQSALSMFEQGDATKLNEETVLKLSKKFDVQLFPKAEAATASTVATLQTAPAKGYCPNPSCPSNHSYQVNGKTFLRPDRHDADPVGGRFCAVCGEVLEKRCPNCGAAIHDGAVCSLCGEPYVVV